jgi:hypothetical protein
MTSILLFCRSRNPRSTAPPSTSTPPRIGRRPARGREWSGLMNCRVRPRLRYSRLTARGPDPPDRAQLPLDRLLDAAEPVRYLLVGVAFHLRESDTTERVVSEPPQELAELVNDLRRELGGRTGVDDLTRALAFADPGGKSCRMRRAPRLPRRPRVAARRPAARELALQVGGHTNPTTPQPPHGRHA